MDNEVLYQQESDSTPSEVREDEPYTLKQQDSASKT